MKQLPHSKLSWSSDEDHGDIDIVDDELVIVGTIHYASDAEYIVEACNNYQKAIELLQEAADQINSMLNGDEHTFTLRRINTFLEKI